MSMTTPEPTVRPPSRIAKRRPFSMAMGVINSTFTTDVTGVITLPDGVEMCMPGDNVDMKVELITPIAIEKGLRFAIREGGRTVGSGVVIDVEEA